MTDSIIEFIEKITKRELYQYEKMFIEGVQNDSRLIINTLPRRFGIDLRLKELLETQGVTIITSKSLKGCVRGIKPNKLIIDEAVNLKELRELITKITDENRDDIEIDLLEGMHVRDVSRKYSVDQLAIRLEFDKWD